VSRCVRFLQVGRAEAAEKKKLDAKKWKFQT
jgi:hypothetical protein